MDWMTSNQCHLICTQHAALGIQVLFDLLSIGLLPIFDVKMWSVQIFDCLNIGIQMIFVLL